MSNARARLRCLPACRPASLPATPVEGALAQTTRPRQGPLAGCSWYPGAHRPACSVRACCCVSWHKACRNGGHCARAWLLAAGCCAHTRRLAVSRRRSASLRAQEGQLQPSPVCDRGRWVQIAALTKLLSGGGSGGASTRPASQQASKPAPGRDHAASCARCPCLTNPSKQSRRRPWCSLVLHQAPIPQPPARHCFLASPAVLALCDPESRIPAFHGPAHSSAPPSCLPLRASSLSSPPSWPGGALPGSRLRLIAYLHQTPSIRSRITAAAPLDGHCTCHERWPRLPCCCLTAPLLHCRSLCALTPSRAASGCCDDTALHSSSHPFQPSWSRVKEGANHGRPGLLVTAPGHCPCTCLQVLVHSAASRVLLPSAASARITHTRES
ncbi:hypothetical protein SVAN01_02006 [Stagonosporopsis vannaccii]|nr:hypothetical protein SVAN01_02006 [Stagonosporopsis vannaccii]